MTEYGLDSYSDIQGQARTLRLVNKGQPTREPCKAAVRENVGSLIFCLLKVLGRLQDNSQQAASVCVQRTTDRAWIIFSGHTTLYGQQHHQ